MASAMEQAVGRRKRSPRRLALGALLLAVAAAGVAWWLLRVPGLPPRAILRGQPGGIWELKYTPDGATLIEAGDAEMTLWDVASGKPRLRLRQPHRTPALAISPDSRMVVASNWTEDLAVWDLVTGARLAVLPGTNEPVGVAFSRDGSTLTVVSLRPDSDQVITTWDTQTWRERSRRTIPVRIERVAASLSSDGTVYAVSRYTYSEVVQVWDLKSARMLAELTLSSTYNWTPRALDLSPDGGALVANDVTATAQLWDVETSTRRVTFRGHNRSTHVRQLAFTRDGRTLITTAQGFPDDPWRLPPLPFGIQSYINPKRDDCEISEWIVWDVATGERRAMISDRRPLVEDPKTGLVKQSECMRFAISPDGKTLATAHNDGTIRLRDLGAVAP